MIGVGEDFDVALVLADDLPAFGESEAQASAGLAAGVEGVERVASFEVRDAAPVVFDFDPDVQIGSGGSDLDGSAAGNRAWRALCSTSLITMAS